MKKIIILLIILIPINVKAISASSYIVMDTDTTRVLEGTNIHKKSLIASITKIMTTMVVINNTENLNIKKEMPEEILKSYGSGIYISVKEKLTTKELLYGLMLRSGNDAAIALAVLTAGSMEGFSKLMNETANSLNMNDSNFINSHGLEEKDKANISTAYDMALLSSYAIKNNIYKEITRTKEITVKSDIKTYLWHNKNRLLKEYKYCTGGKTGFTEKARRTLVTNASKNNVNLTVVTFNDGNDFNDHKELYEKYFKKLKNYKIVKKGKIKTNIDNTYIEESFNMSLTKEERKNIKVNINYYDTNVTNIIGNLTVTLNSKEYFKTNIIKKENVKPKETFFQKLKRKILNLW